MLAPIEIQASACGQFIVTRIAKTVRVSTIQQAREIATWYAQQATRHAEAAHPPWAVTHCQEPANAILRSINEAIENSSADKREG